MPPQWLETLAWISLGVAFLCAIIILWDIFVAGNRQPMGVMEAVWPITALYLGPLGLWAYWHWARVGRPEEQDQGEPRPKPFPVKVAIGVSHCGAGCTLGDIIATGIVFALGLTIAGLALPYEYVFDFTFAFLLGIVFQFFAIRPMRPEMPLGQVLKKALKADTLSLTAFEVGLFGWMAIMQLVLFKNPHLSPEHASYWFLMQIGMAIGFMTSYPVNIWLIRRGIKETMA